MNTKRISAILHQELYLSLRSVEVIMDLFFFPLVNVVVFGFLSLYLGGNKNSLAGQYVLLGMLLWQIIWIIEYSVSVGSLWNIWSRNLSNLFISPLQLKEYLLAHLLSGIAKAILILLVSIFLSIYLFQFNILSIGFIPLVITFINFVIFAFSLGLIMLGLIFRYGTKVQAFAWGIVPIFQPLSAAFYPLQVLPLPLQYIAYLFPPTFTFEAARYSLTYHAINWQLFGISFLGNIIYCFIAVLWFAHMFKKAKDTGQFARNES